MLISHDFSNTMDHHHLHLLRDSGGSRMSFIRFLQKFPFHALLILAFFLPCSFKEENVLLHLRPKSTGCTSAQAGYQTKTLSTVCNIHPHYVHVCVNSFSSQEGYCYALTCLIWSVNSALGRGLLMPPADTLLAAAAATHTSKHGEDVTECSFLIIIYGSSTHCLSSHLFFLLLPCFRRAAASVCWVSLNHYRSSSRFLRPG